MSSLKTRDVAIAGVAETALVRNSGRSALALAGEALDSLLATTGIDKSDIDGLAVTLAMSEAPDPFWSALVAEALGLEVDWAQATDIGGSSNIGNIARAAAAIGAGFCETVVCIGADAVSTQDKSAQSWHRPEFCAPLGYLGPVAAFGLLGSAYAERHGWPDEALAALAVAQRQGALLNPIACQELKKPLTREDFLASRKIADPLRLLDCVMRCDGASAFLVTSTARARDLGLSDPVHPVAYRERINFDPRGAQADITVSGFSAAGPRALAAAGLAPADIDLFAPYDDFLIAILMQLEQIGFCRAGEGGRYVLDRDVSWRGDFPINPGGGQVSCGQPGLAGGGVNLAEAVRQMRGQAGARQVGKADRAMVTGIGVLPYARNWGSSAVMILERGR